MVEEIEISDGIDELEAAMLENFDAVECPINDHFAEGIYGREMLAPKGTLITSKIHKTEHLFILLKGKIAIHLQNGEEVILEAPYIGVTKAGTRRVGYVMEDVSWAFNVHRRTGLSFTVREVA